LRDAATRAAGTCYDHLAGKLALPRADAMIERGHIERSPDVGAVTPNAPVFLPSLGVDLGAAEARATKRVGSERVCDRPCWIGANATACGRRSLRRLRLLLHTAFDALIHSVDSIHTTAWNTHRFDPKMSFESG